MDEFLHQLNVEKYKRLLREAPENSRRAMLMRLLAEEAVKAEAAGWLPRHD